LRTSLGGRKRRARPSCSPRSPGRARRTGSPRGGGRSAWRSARGPSWRRGPRPGGTVPRARTCPRRRSAPGCRDPRGLGEHPRPVLDDGEDEGQVHRVEALVGKSSVRASITRRSRSCIPSSARRRWALSSMPALRSTPTPRTHAGRCSSSMPVPTPTIRSRSSLRRSRAPAGCLRTSRDQKPRDAS
jgi:hypothetical protein